MRTGHRCTACGWQIVLGCEPEDEASDDWVRGVYCQHCGLAYELSPWRPERLCACEVGLDHGLELAGPGRWQHVSSFPTGSGSGRLTCESCGAQGPFGPEGPFRTEPPEDGACPRCRATAVVEDPALLAGPPRPRHGVEASQRLRNRWREGQVGGLGYPLATSGESVQPAKGQDLEPDFLGLIRELMAFGVPLRRTGRRWLRLSGGPGTGAR